MNLIGQSLSLLPTPLGFEKSRVSKLRWSLAVQPLTSTQPNGPMSRLELPGFCWSWSSFWITTRNLDSGLLPGSFGYRPSHIFILSTSLCEPRSLRRIASNDEPYHDGPDHNNPLFHRKLFDFIIKFLLLNC